MSNLKNIKDIDEETTYFDFKGYKFRLEISDYENGNLTVRIKRKNSDDWEHKYVAVDDPDEVWK